ncbi:hypothetical protein D3C77_798130 [compost metagenome]
MENEIIDGEIYEWFDDLNSFRNSLVHNVGGFDPQEYIETYTSSAQNLREKLAEIISARL